MSGFVESGTPWRGGTRRFVTKSPTKKYLIGLSCFLGELLVNYLEADRPLTFSLSRSFGSGLICATFRCSRRSRFT